MSQRLQVLFQERELREIQRIARKHRLTVAEWVRQTLRKAARQESQREPASKLKAVRAAYALQFPVADIEKLNQESQSGAMQGLP